MAKSKSSTDKKRPTPSIVGYRLCVWCKGGLDSDNNPITAPWQLVYAPYWRENHQSKPACVGWNGSPIVFGVVDTRMDYDTSTEAFDVLQRLPADVVNVAPADIHSKISEIYINS